MPSGDPADPGLCSGFRGPGSHSGPGQAQRWATHPHTAAHAGSGGARSGSRGLLLRRASNGAGSRRHRGHRAPRGATGADRPQFPDAPLGPPGAGSGDFRRPAMASPPGRGSRARLAARPAGPWAGDPAPPVVADFLTTSILTRPALTGTFLFPGVSACRRDVQRARSRGLRAPPRGRVLPPAPRGSPSPHAGHRHPPLPILREPPAG